MTDERQTSTGPLAGIRILDLTRVLAGPTATQLLGDLGAEVIKIEKPGEGDDTRKWGPPYVRDADGRETNESAYYLSTNRNKRSVAVDIARPEGAALVRRLAAKCDILVENFKVGGLARYGLSYDDLKDELPRLVYCSITGFGQTGPNRLRPGYDYLAQGMSGIMSITGVPGTEPVKVGVAIADVMCGMYATAAILAALHHRTMTGRGQHIDIGLVDTAVAWLVNEGANYLASGKVPIQRGNAHANIVPYQVFEAADGHIIVAVGNERQYRHLCDFLGAPELTGPPFATNSDRVAHRAELVPRIAGRLKTLTRAEIVEGLEEHGVPVGAVNNIAEAFAEPQVEARGMRITMPHPLAGGSGTVDLIGNPVKLSETPVTYRDPPPFLGQHTDEVLQEMLGLDEAERERLREAGAI